MNRLTLLLVAASLTLTGCATSTDTPAELFDVAGTVTAPSGAQVEYVGLACDMFRGMDDNPVEGNYDDITTGAQVTAVDENGTTVAVGKLGDGVLEESGEALVCSYGFTLTELPDTSFYGIRVGGSTRGDVQFTKAEMQSGPSIVID